MPAVRIHWWFRGLPDDFGRNRMPRGGCCAFFPGPKWPIGILIGIA
jgi:hypothetical protein